VNEAARWSLHQDRQRAGGVDDRAAGRPQEQDPEPCAEENLEKRGAAACDLSELDQKRDLG